MGDLTLGVDSERSELRLLHTLLNQLPALVAYWDAEGRNVVANHAYFDYFGITPEELRGMHISELLGDDLYARNLPFITGALAGQEQLFDRTLIDQFGRTRHTQASYMPDVENDVVKGFFVMVTDVTPRVEAQRAMDQAQAIAKLGSWELEVATSVVTWSRNLYEIVGLDPHDDSTLTLPVRKVLIHPEDRDGALANIEQATRTGKPYVHQYRILTVDGDVREVVSKGRPVTGKDGQVTRINGTMQDVTETNAAARALAQVNAELRRANELNADVIAMLGHDLRNPLTAVLFLLDHLENDWESLDDDQRRGVVSRARAASERLGVLIERTLALAAIDAGIITPTRDDLDLAGIVDQIVREAGLSGTPSIEIDATAREAVSFDRVHLQQILANLLTNAFRYGSEPVRVVATRVGDRLELAVTDAGSGVPPAEVGALFGRFARTGLRQLDAGGTGLGLYLSAQLAAANGATLSYRPSQDDRSHAFVLVIPDRPAADLGH